MKTYFAYVRVSTARQCDEGTSPQEQRHAITGYALRQGLDIAGWYEERESAAKQGRPEYIRAFTEYRIAMREKSNGDIVAINSGDRSATKLKQQRRESLTTEKGAEAA
jgi:site-specific DNA recombinase